MLISYLQGGKNPAGAGGVADRQMYLENRIDALVELRHARAKIGGYLALEWSRHKIQRNDSGKATVKARGKLYFIIRKNGVKRYENGM